MKAILKSAIVFAATLQLSLAGGNTSVVELDKVTSIKIEDDKVTIVGSGTLSRRVICDPKHGDSSVFGQKAQMLHAKFTDCTFEFIPYHVNPDVEGVPGSGPYEMKKEMITMSEKWWAGAMETAAQIKVGEPLTIGFQREKLTITGFSVTHIIGSGSLTIPKAAKD